MTESSRIETGSPLNRGKRSRWLLAGVVLFLLSGLLAHFHWLWPPVNVINDFAWAPFVLINLALPWLLQWAGVACGLLAVAGPRANKQALQFSLVLPLGLGLIWWAVLAWRFHGVGLLDVLVAINRLETQFQWGDYRFSDELLFNTLAPTIGVFQLSGPLNLQGWGFVISACSIATLVGYLYLVGKWCNIGGTPTRLSDVLKFTVALVPLFLPALAKTVLRIAGPFA